MERINQIIDNVEQDLKKEVKVESVDRLQEHLESFDGLFNQISEKMREATAVIADQDLNKFEDFIKIITKELNVINTQFADFIELTKQMQTQEALKQYLIQKLDEIFAGMAEQAARSFSMSTMEIYDEFSAQLKEEMQTSLFGRIEQELFSIKDGLGKFQKTYEMADQQFDLVQKAIVGLQMKYKEKFDAIKKDSEVFPQLLQGLTKDFEDMPKEIQVLQGEITEIISAIRDAPLQLLQKLRDEFHAYQAEIEAQYSKLEEEKKTLQQEKIDLQQDTIKLQEEKRELAKEKKELSQEKDELAVDLGKAEKQVETLDKETKMSAEEIKRMQKEHAAMKAELESLSGQLEKVTDEFATLSKERKERMERSDILALIMTLLVEVFGAQPHSKILFLLHGQKETMGRKEIIKASGIAGAAVRKALADLAAAKLVNYDIESESATLLKKIF